MELAIEDEATELSCSYLIWQDFLLKVFKVWFVGMFWAELVITSVILVHTSSKVRIDQATKMTIEKGVESTEAEHELHCYWPELWGEFPLTV